MKTPDEEIIKLAVSKEPICPEGRVYLAERGLSIPLAEKRGFCSKDGIMYFIYTQKGKPVRFKGRSMTNKTMQFMSKPLSGFDETTPIPFFCQFKCPTSADLFITEGEFDSLAISSLGASNAVSLPNGSGSVETSFRNNYEFLQQFDRIFICFDMDKCGQEAAKKAMSMISPAKYRRINFPEGCKDANDWVRNNPDLEFVDLQKLMDQADKIEDAAVTNVETWDRTHYGAVNMGLSTGWSKLDAIIGGMRPGELTVISAETGSGKSTFCLNFMKNLADQKQGIWVNSYEMAPEMTNRKFASIVLGKPMKCKEFSDADFNKYQKYLHNHQFFLNTTNKHVGIDELRKLLELVRYGYGIKYILLDHLDYIVSSGKKTILENIDETMRGLHALALEFKVAIILVAHPKQMPANQEVTSNDLRGSSSIKQYADNIIIITRMDRIVDDAEGRVKVRIWKNRLLGNESFFYLQYNQETDGYTQLEIFQKT